VHRSHRRLLGPESPGSLRYSGIKLRLAGCSRLFALCGLAALVIAGCTPSTDTQQIQSDQFTLRGMVANDQQQIDSLQEKVQRLDDRISELQHNGSPSAGSGDQLASIERRLSKLEAQSKNQGGAANAPAGDAVNAPSGTAPAPEGLGASESAPPGGAEGSAALAPATGGVESAPGSGSSGSEAATTNPPSWRAMMEQELSASHDDPGEKLYRAGLLQLKANRYPEALSQFEALQRRDPKSDLSEPAEFFAANALYEMGKYDQAILQFNDQTMRFPKGRYASAALLREAQAFMKINDRIDARLTLQKLLNDLPDSPEAPMAKSMMQTLTS
jgi:TolA-binding protein